MPNWERTTLGAVCESTGGGIQTGPFGSQLHASDYVDEGIPSVMPQNIGDNRIIKDGIAQISSADAVRLSKYLLRTGDIVYSRRGDVERRALVRPENDGWFCGTGCLRVRLGPNDRHDPLFISYALGTVESRQWIKRHAVGATMLNLNTGILSAVPLSLPAIDDQRAIAEVLGALDDKIATNDRLVQRLEGLMSLRWRMSTIDGELAPLSSLAQFVNGKAFTKDATGAGRVVIRIAELNSGIGPSTVLNDIDVDECYLARPGDLLFAWSGSLTVTRWFRDEAIINQHIFKVIPTGGQSLWLVAQALYAKLAEFKAVAADKATTMGHIQRRHLDEPVLVPPTEEISRLDTLMSGLWDRALAAERENLALISTRDELLPLLMSGQVRVAGAKKFVEEVV